MARAAGRDQTAPMERLVRLIGALTAHPDGAPAELLLTAVEPPDEALRGSAAESHDEARRKMLSRDLEHLNALGYDVRNVAEVGSEGRYVMRARDNRLQVSLSAQQRGELLRAALAAGLEDMARHLGNGGAGAGVEGGVDEGDSPLDVELDPPGSAPAFDEPVRPSLDPLSWEVDPAVDVVLGLAAEHRVIVENLLGPAASVAEAEDGELLLGYRVTNRRVLRNRVYELGTRVRVVSPAVVRDEILAELRSFVAGPS